MKSQPSVTGVTLYIQGQGRERKRSLVLGQLHAELLISPEARKKSFKCVAHVHSWRMQTI